MCIMFTPLNRVLCMNVLVFFPDFCISQLFSSFLLKSPSLGVNPALCSQQVNLDLRSQQVISQMLLFRLNPALVKLEIGAITLTNLP